MSSIELRVLIEQKLTELLIQKTPHPLIAPLFDAACYSLSSGKRLRPLLALKTAEIYGVSLECSLTPACALELIHTYSLIHDDLPCMDDDDLRRGAPTLHKVYNEGHAVLTGDFLLTYAFEVLSKAPYLSSETRLTLIDTLSERAGASGMLGGQVLDLSIKNFDRPILDLLQRKKTGALFSCALEFGGILGSAPKSDLELLKQIGENLGIAYQIFDDIEDAGEEGASCLQLLSPQEAQKVAVDTLALISKDMKQLSKPAMPLELFVDTMCAQFQ